MNMGRFPCGVECGQENHEEEEGKIVRNVQVDTNGRRAYFLRIFFYYYFIIIMVLYSRRV